MATPIPGGYPSIQHCGRGESACVRRRLSDIGCSAAKSFRVNCRRLVNWITIGRCSDALALFACRVAHFVVFMAEWLPRCNFVVDAPEQKALIRLREKKHNRNGEQQW